MEKVVLLMNAMVDKNYYQMVLVRIAYHIRELKAAKHVVQTHARHDKSCLRMVLVKIAYLLQQLQLMGGSVRLMSVMPEKSYWKMDSVRLVQTTIKLILLIPKVAN